MANKSFPDILAVDPTGCGCTECIIGEYVQEDRWVDTATPADVLAVIQGEVGNNTFSSLYGLTLDNYFGNDTTNDFVRDLKEHAMELLVRYGDLDQIADRHDYL